MTSISETDFQSSSFRWHWIKCIFLSVYTVVELIWPFKRLAPAFPFNVKRTPLICQRTSRERHNPINNSPFRLAYISWGNYILHRIFQGFKYLHLRVCQFPSRDNINVFSTHRCSRASVSDIFWLLFRAFEDLMSKEKILVDLSEQISKYGRHRWKLLSLSLPLRIDVLGSLPLKY